MLCHKVGAIDEMASINGTNFVTKHQHHCSFDGASAVWMLYHCRFVLDTNFAPNIGYHFPFVSHFCFVPKSLRQISLFERCQLYIISFVARSHNWTHVRGKIALTVNTYSKQWTMTLWLTSTVALWNLKPHDMLASCKCRWNVFIFSCLIESTDWAQLLYKNEHKVFKNQC